MDAAGGRVTKEDRAALLLTIGFAAIVLLYYVDGQGAGVPADITKTADSLEATRPALDSQLARSARAGDSSARVQRQLQLRERRIRARADSLERLADSLAAIGAAATSAADSAKAYAAAYELEKATADSLRAENQAKDARIQLLVADTTRLAGDRDSLQRRNQALEAFTMRLRSELAKATECKLIGPIRCPTRRETAVVSALAGVVAASR